jgi:hypothetical protein
MKAGDYFKIRVISLLSSVSEFSSYSCTAAANTEMGMAGMSLREVEGAPAC